MIFKQINQFLIIIGLLLASCDDNRKPTDENTLYVSILPLRHIVQGIVGDDFPIEVLVPPGASPETFEPTPRQFIGLNRARSIFSTGLIDFETALLDKLETPEKIVNLSHGIELLAGTCSHGHASGKETEHYPTAEADTHHTCDHAECGHAEQAHTEHAEEHHHTHGIDPHIWTSPRALQRMAANAYEAIERLYPDSTKYAANYAALQQRLQALDARTAEKIAQSGVKYFIIYHPALTYYARDYGLQQIAIEHEGKEPSARSLARLIRRAREDKVSKIFYQSQFPASAVEIIAKDIEARSVRIDPLCEDVIANIDAITDQIVQP